MLIHEMIILVCVNVSECQIVNDTITVDTSPNLIQAWNNICDSYLSLIMIDNIFPKDQAEFPILTICNTMIFVQKGIFSLIFGAQFF